MKKTISILLATIFFLSLTSSQEIKVNDAPETPENPPDSGTDITDFPDTGDDSGSGSSGGGGGGSSGRTIGQSCSANSQCRIGLCCTAGGLFPGTCRSQSNLYGGICMGSQIPSQPNPYIPPTTNEQPPAPIRLIENIVEEARERPVLAIILTIVGIAVIVAAISLIIIFFRKRK